MRKYLLFFIVIGFFISSVRAFDPSHAGLTHVMEKFNKKGLVDYKNLKADPFLLSNYLVTLDLLSEEEFAQWTTDQKMAFWINAYNAFTLKAIIDHYPIQSSFLKLGRYPKNSIRQIRGVWTKLTFNVMGKELTLDDIEHKILRKKFDEPRIHMALVCAALSCPPLREEAYTGEHLSEQLDDQTRQFLGHPKKFRMDEENLVVYLSPIFDWFGDDFVGNYGQTKYFSERNKKNRAVLNFISGYLSRSDRQFLQSDQFILRTLPYDWKLNEP